MRSVGADHVIDYRRDDFTRTSQPYDLILDLAAHRSVFAYRRALAPGGTCGAWVGRCPLLRVLTAGRLVGRSPVAHRDPCRQGGAGPLRAACRPCTTRDVRIHIHRTFALDEVPAALAHVGEGRASDKVVVVLS